MTMLMKKNETMVLMNNATLAKIKKKRRNMPILIKEKR